MGYSACSRVTFHLLVNVPRDTRARVHRWGHLMTEQVHHHVAVVAKRMYVCLFVAAGGVVYLFVSCCFVLLLRGDAAAHLFALLIEATRVNARTLAEHDDARRLTCYAAAGCSIRRRP